MMDLEMVTTRGGDKGTAALYDGRRISKSSLYFDCLGSIDELNSWLGVVKVHSYIDSDKTVITALQTLLFAIGSLTATSPESEIFASLRQIEESDIETLEKQEHAILEEVQAEPEFVYPGKNELSAWIDLARAVCRRTERAMVKLREEYGLAHLELSQKFLNRLSDYLFLLARKFDRNS